MGGLKSLRDANFLLFDVLFLNLVGRSGDIFTAWHFTKKTFRGSSQDAVVGKRILFSHDIVSNLTAWKNEK